MNTILHNQSAFLHIKIKDIHYYEIIIKYIKNLLAEIKIVLNKTTSSYDNTPIKLLSPSYHKFNKFTLHATNKLYLNE